MKNNPMTGRLRRTAVWFETLFQALYDVNAEKLFRFLGPLWLGGLYLLGLLLWSLMLSFGRVPMDTSDWADINLPRLTFEQQALRSGQLPLHMQNATFLHDVTDRFFSLPDVISTPEMLSLLVLNVGQYVLFETLFMFTVSTLGLLWLRHKFKLSLFVFTILFLLVNFNGYIQAHYAMGHITWGGYFLFPLFFALIFLFLEGKAGWRWVALMALLLFYAVLLGSEHHFLWLAIFLCVLGLVRWRQIKWIFFALLFAGLLSAFRLLPPVLDLRGLADSVKFIPSFPTTDTVIAAMAVLRTFDTQMLATRGGYWEFDLYIGLVGTALVLFFGVFHWARDILRSSRFRDLLWPALALFFLSLGHNYLLLRATNFPLFAGERVSSRLIAVTFVLVIILGMIFLQEWLERNPLNTPLRIAGLALPALILFDLWGHIRLWRVSAIGELLPRYTTNVNYASIAVANHPDPPYFMLLGTGLVLSLGAAATLAFLVWRERKQAGISS